MKKVSILILLSAVVVLGIVMIISSKTVNCNNSTQYDELIKKSYAPVEIGRLIAEVESSEMDFFEFTQKYKVECLRKTYKGYYAILLQTDGRKVFVFIDTQLNLTDVMVVEQFLSKEDFIIQNSDGSMMTIDEVTALYPNTIPIPISMVTQTAHIVKEGVIIVTYTRFDDGAVLEQATASEIRFVDNDDLVAESSDYGLKRIPYILAIDKCNE